MTVLRNMAHTLVLPLALALAGTGCMAQGPDDGPTSDDPAVAAPEGEGDVAGATDQAKQDDTTGEAQQACGCGFGGLGGWGGGFGGCGGFGFPGLGCGCGGFGFPGYGLGYGGFGYPGYGLGYGGFGYPGYGLGYGGLGCGCGC